jgi:hypothetical protein
VAHLPRDDAIAFLRGWVKYQHFPRALTGLAQLLGEEVTAASPYQPYGPWEQVGHDEPWGFCVAASLRTTIVSARAALARVKGHIDSVMLAMPPSSFHA